MSALRSSGRLPRTGTLSFLCVRPNCVLEGVSWSCCPTFDDEAATGLEDLMDHANAVLAEMVDQGALHAEERERMVVGNYPRRSCDLLAPFQSDGQFQGLSVEFCGLVPLPDSAWAEYERDGNVEALATKYALFFRSAFIPSLAAGLTEADDPAQRRIFAGRFENGLKRRLAKQPAPLHSFVQIFVVSKREGTL